MVADFLSYVIGRAFAAVGEFIFEVVGYHTMRAIVRLVSFGRLRVAPFFSAERFGWPGWKRTQTGLLIGPTLASGIGVAIWVAAAIAALSYFA